MKFAFGESWRQAGGRTPKARFSAAVYVFAALVIFSFSLLVLSTRSFFLDVGSMGISLFSGVRGGVYEVSSFFSRTVLSMRELSDLRKEHAALLLRLERYEELEHSNAETNQENARLREQLGFARTLHYRHIAAEIIGRDPDNLFSALVINKGRHSGVANNMAVIAWQNGKQALVGKVLQAGAFESLVMPIYDASTLAAARFSSSRYDGIVEGQGDPEVPLLMRLIPKRARDEINIGDMVVSSGMGGIIPAGINIGRVSAVSYREYEITMEADIQPVIDFSRLEYVFVIEAETETETEAENG